MDKSTEDSAQHRKVLLEFFQSTLEKIRNEFMVAAAKPIGYIPCPHCSSLHIKFIKRGVQLCNAEIIAEDYYRDLYNKTPGMST